MGNRRDYGSKLGSPKSHSPPSSGFVLVIIIPKKFVGKCAKDAHQAQTNTIKCWVVDLDLQAHVRDIGNLEDFLLCHVVYSALTFNNSFICYK